jgi:hypothetical protein
MADLYLHGQRVESIFQLLGEKENDISYSVAWVLARSSAFLREFLRATLDLEPDTEQINVSIQHHEAEGGITDIEIVGSQLHVIIEAKCGWALPNKSQLERYANRRSFIRSNAPLKRLMVLSECTKEYAQVHLETCAINGIPVQSISWKNMADAGRKAQSKGTNAEKRLIEELITYFGGVMTLQKKDSNWVYVVSLSSSTREGWRISWIDIVKNHRRYFHQVGGNGWPKEPPNYIAFRYYGKLQSIHHIEGYEIVTNLHSRIPEIPSKERREHFLYRLGPAFAPDHEVRTGKIYPNGRVWCMLDTLFTAKTISEARDISQKRRSYHRL